MKTQGLLLAKSFSKYKTPVNGLCLAMSGNTDNCCIEVLPRPEKSYKYNRYHKKIYSKFLKDYLSNI